MRTLARFGWPRLIEPRNQAEIGRGLGQQRDAAFAENAVKGPSAMAGVRFGREAAIVAACRARRANLKNNENKDDLRFPRHPCRARRRVQQAGSAARGAAAGRGRDAALRARHRLGRLFGPLRARGRGRASAARIGRDRVRAFSRWATGAAGRSAVRDRRASVRRGARARAGARWRGRARSSRMRMPSSGARKRSSATSSSARPMSRCAWPCSSAPPRSSRRPRRRCRRRT